MATPTTDEMYGPATDMVKVTDMTRYAQSEVQIPLLKALSMAETLERFELAVGRKPGDLLINIYNAANALPQIYQCVPETVINAALDAAVLKLSLAKSLGLGCILPYKKYTSKVGTDWKYEMRAQFIVMVRGLKELAMRTNRYRRLNEFYLYEGEFPVFDRKSGDFSEGGKRTGDAISHFGAFLRLENSFEYTVCWSAEKVLAHGKQYSPTYDDKKGVFSSGSRWVTHFDEQGTKTVMKNLITHHGVISDVDRSNLERIESKADGDIIDGEIKEDAPRIEQSEAPVILNSPPATSATTTAPAQPKAEEPTRPYTPAIFKERFAVKAAQLAQDPKTIAFDSHRKIVAAAIDGIFNGESTMRYEVCEWLTGHSSTKDMSESEIWALLKLMAVTGFNQAPSENSMTEFRAAHVESLKAKGQMELGDIPTTEGIPV